MRELRRPILTNVQDIISSQFTPMHLPDGILGRGAFPMGEHKYKHTYTTYHVCIYECEKLLAMSGRVLNIMCNRAI